MQRSDTHAGTARKADAAASGVWRAAQVEAWLQGRPYEERAGATGAANDWPAGADGAPPQRYTLLPLHSETERAPAGGRPRGREATEAEARRRMGWPSAQGHPSLPLLPHAPPTPAPPPSPPSSPVLGIGEGGAPLRPPSPPPSPPEATVSFLLTAAHRRSLSSDILSETPGTLQLGCPLVARRAIVEDWESYISSSTKRFLPSGYSGADTVTWTTFWTRPQQRWFLALGLDKRARRGLPSNLVLTWLSSSTSRHVSRLRAIHEQIVEVATALHPSPAEVARPVFIHPAATETGDVHSDDFHSLVLVLSGRKQFWILAPELLDRPAKGSTLWHISTKEATSPPWTCVILEPGDVFFLPAGWWHCVLSDAHTIMVNYWWSAAPHSDPLPPPPPPRSPPPSPPTEPTQQQQQQQQQHQQQQQQERRRPAPILPLSAAAASLL